MRVQNIVFVFFCTLNFQVLGVALSRKSNRENGSTAVIARMDPEILQYSWDPTTHSMVLGSIDPGIVLPVITRDLMVRDARTSLSLSTRDTPRWFQIGVKSVVWAAQGPATQVLAWVGLLSACRSFVDPSNQYQCVMGAIAIAISYCARSVEFYKWYGSFRDERRAQGWFVGTINHLGYGRALKVRRLEELSKLIGSEVHYAGEYQDKVEDGLHQREVVAPESVFGFTNHLGVDMHLMIRDGKSPDSVSMRLGFGNGFGDKNGERVKRDLKVKRDLGPTDVHFAEGGINLIAQTGDERQLDDKEDFHHILNMVRCHFDLPNRWEENGLYFQMYDLIKRDTLISGALAPYLPTQHSAISHMKNVPHPILYESPECAAVE